MLVFVEVSRWLPPTIVYSGVALLKPNRAAQTKPGEIRHLRCRIRSDSGWLKEWPLIERPLQGGWLVSGARPCAPTKTLKSLAEQFGQFLLQGVFLYLPCYDRDNLSVFIDKERRGRTDHVVGNAN